MKNGLDEIASAEVLAEMRSVNVGWISNGKHYSDSSSKSDHLENGGNVCQALLHTVIGDSMGRSAL